jgi:hypothetical protein
MTRYSPSGFQTANPIYAGATVTFWTVDGNGDKTATRAQVYEAPFGTGLLANPQTLDSEGKFQTPIYLEEPTIAEVGGTVSTHETGIQSPMVRSRGVWATATVYGPGEVVRDGPAGANTGNSYICNFRHTSGVWADDLADDYWDVFADLSVQVGQAQDAADQAEGFKDDAEAARDQAAASAAAAAAAAGSGLFGTISDKSASFSITADTDNATLFKVNSAGGSIVVSLPSIAVAQEGERYGFMRTSASNTVTLARDGTDTINGVAGNYVIPAVAGDIYLIVADDDSPDNWIVIPWAQSTADGLTLTKTGAVIALNLANPNTWTAPQRAANAAANAGSFDMSAKNDFTCTPTGAAALTFTNKVSGQRGMILLNYTSYYAITRAANVEADEDFDALMSVTGKYQIQYWCYDGTNVALSYSGAIS